MLRLIRILPLVLALGWLSALSTACSSTGWQPAETHQLEPVRAQDRWSVKIEAWRSREAASGLFLGAQPRSLLGARLDEFLLVNRSRLESGETTQRRVARELVAWFQGLMPEHFRPDANGDDWPALTEVVSTGADDCDGLELVALHMLRELGFAHEELYRGLLYNPDDGRYHMATLWFEDDRDPSREFMFSLVRLR